MADLGRRIPPAFEDVSVMTAANLESAAVLSRASEISLRGLASALEQDTTDLTPPSLSRDALGLPPTPPTLTNSDLAAPRKESLATDQEFAEAVRYALRSKTSGTVTPTGPQQAPQTPDPSPPGRKQNSASTATQVTHSPPRLRSNPSLQGYSSSRAESFHTARENVESSVASMSRNLSPLSEDASQLGSMPTYKATSSTTLKPSGLHNLVIPTNSSESHSEDGTATPGSPEQPRKYSALRDLEFSDDNLEAQLQQLKLVSDSPLLRRSFAASLPSPPESAQRSTQRPSTWHSTQVEKPSAAQPPSDEGPAASAESKSGDGDVATARPATSQRSLRKARDSPDLRRASRSTSGSAGFQTVLEPNPNPTVTGPVVLSPQIPESDDTESVEQQRSLPPTEPSTELVNNLVYREIREENVKRHSALHGGGALRVGIIIPKASPGKTLKRTSKFETLRDNASEGVRSQRNSLGSPHRLRHKKALPAASPEASPEMEPGWNYTRRAASFKIRPSTAPTSAHERTVADSGTRSLSASVPSQGPARLLEPSIDPSTTMPQRRTINSTSAKLQEPSISPPQREHTLRRFSREAQLENNTHVRRTSLASKASDSSAHRTLDVPFLHPAATPLSTSQFSDRTDVELCEAQGITIFPHNNESVLVLEHGSLPTSRDNASSRSSDLHFPISLPPQGLGVHVRPASPSQPSSPREEKHSPLTNPRAAPEPPAFRVIPPTPSDMEQEFMLQDEKHESDMTSKARPSQPQRSLSITQRARRYSESYIRPLFTRYPSLRRRPQTAASTDVDRPTHLSPFWRPRYFWEEYDSSDDEYEEDDDDPLPPGGDTSDVPEPAKLLPRNMSVRMPGFRGNGGFLVGNSLGLERHGTNSRRHHVPRRRSNDDLPSRVHNRRASLGLVTRGPRSLTPIRFRQRFSQIRSDRAERALERRREALRGQIQHTR